MLPHNSSPLLLQRGQFHRRSKALASAPPLHRRCTVRGTPGQLERWQLTSHALVDRTARPNLPRKRAIFRRLGVQQWEGPMKLLVKLAGAALDIGSALLESVGEDFALLRL